MKVRRIAAFLLAGILLAYCCAGCSDTAKKEEPPTTITVWHVYGGQTDAEQLRIAPTIVTDVTWDDPVMQEEIFGPILPILTFSQMEEALEEINAHPHPLAFYLFTEDKKTVMLLTKSIKQYNSR